MMWPKLRVHEWIFITFFAYVAAISPLFNTRPHLHGQPFVLFVAVCVVFFLVARLQKTRLGFGVEIARDWLPIAFTFLAFREMEYFAPSQYDFLTEMSWIRWDLILLEGFQLRQRIESLGALIPTYLEICYLLIYGVSAYCIARLSAVAGRRAIDRFWNIFLLGTLGSYALFPYFPTEPPRYSFPDISPPTQITWVRHLNLSLLNGTTIHAGVFPSAHVSAAFSAAFAMILLLPKRQWDGWVLLFYAASVALATVYGRYHYAVDAMAGFGISLLAAALCLLYYAYDLKQRAKTSR
jgi:membrane-associated phospholipid phosphatase